MLKNPTKTRWANDKTSIQPIIEIAKNNQHVIISILPSKTSTINTTN